MPRRPTRSDLLQTTLLFGACTLAYAAGLIIGLPEKYWALISVIAVTQPMLADTLAAGIDRVLGVLIGAAAGFLVLELSQHHVPLPPLFWIALLPLSLLIAMRPHLWMAAATLVVVVLVPGSGLPYVRPFDRVIEILLGILASIIVAALIRPRRRARAPAASNIVVDRDID